MTNLQKKIATAITTGSLLLNVVGPVFAGTTIIVSGNGANSENEAEVKFEQERTVVQSNNADVENNVTAKANTGKNEAEKNNGGNVKIDTGDSKTDVSVKNSLNTNHADLACCANNDVEVKIAGNAADSENEVELKLDYDTNVFQSNKADVDNEVEAYSNSGKNEAEKNNGGDVTIKTGSATTMVTVGTAANSNSALVGGGSGGGGTLSAWIVNNAADSDNDIELEFEKETAIVQSNSADIENDVDAYATTGENEAEKNNGGIVEIDTGDALTDVMIDNAVNFNWAAVECDCLFSDLLAKIADNGYGSENEIELKLEDELEVFQDNCSDPKYNGPSRKHRGGRDGCELENEVEAYSSSGKNEAEENNDGGNGDPSIETGDATTKVNLENSGNSNVFGDVPEWDFDFGNGFNLNISLDLGALLAQLLG